MYIIALLKNQLKLKFNILYKNNKVGTLSSMSLDRNHKYDITIEDESKIDDIIAFCIGIIISNRIS